MEQVLKQRKDIAFYFILVPFNIKDAYWKSKSIICNKSFAMLADSFAKKELPPPDCGTNQIDANFKLAEVLGITGTPALISPDGRIHMGTMPAKELIDFIDGVPKAQSK